MTDYSTDISAGQIAAMGGSNASIHRIIVIGASTGGFEALKTIVKSLPASLNGSIFVVWHMAANAGGIIANALSKLTTIYTAIAYDKEPIQNNRIYIAQPDHHLIIEDGVVRVTNGPKENRFRPSVDPLFRSAAYAYGNRVIGVVLSGGLDDGTAGLWKIKEHGGTAVVQHPNDAEVPSMPQHALQHVAVDYTVPAAEIGALLVQLCNEPLIQRNSDGNDEPARIEIGIAAGQDSFKEGSLQIGQLSPFSCPDCHGVLSSIKEGTTTRFRCHTGHAYSPEALLASLTEDVESGLYSALRGLDETVLLLNSMGDHFSEANHPALAGHYFEKALSTKKLIRMVRGTIAAQTQGATSKPATENEQGEMP